MGGGGGRGEERGWSVEQGEEGKDIDLHLIRIRLIRRTIYRRLRSET